MLSAVLFLDKPLGWSSRRAVNEVVRLFTPAGEKKIKAGHTGTLDPLATGMLPILLGDATRFSGQGLEAEKIYRFTLNLSYQTDSLDCEGETTSKFEVKVTESELQAVAGAFLGDIMQVPPTYSAIRIDGKRAHRRARDGESIELPPRPVTIHELELLSFDSPNATFRVRCSKGTYVRSLARDIGERLGVGGCVTELRRLSTGGWPEAMMVNIEEVAEKRESVLLPLSMWLREFPDVMLSPEDGRRFLQGQRIQVSDTHVGHVKVFANRELLGTAELKPGMKSMVLHPSRILPSAQEKLL